MSTAAWKAVSVGSTLVATKVATVAVSKGWRVVTGRPVPHKDDYEKDQTRDIIIYTALVAAAIGVARVVLERKAVEYYRASTGHLPKGLDEPPLSKSERKAHKTLEKAKDKASDAADAVDPTS